MKPKIDRKVKCIDGMMAIPAENKFYIIVSTSSNESLSLQFTIAQIKEIANQFNITR